MENKISWHYNLQINKPVILFLHAFPTNSDMWEPQFKLLKQMNLPCIAPDYPGYGKSVSPHTQMEIDDFAHTIHSILIQNSITEIIGIGLSMGGYIALALYRLYPELFKGLVLADTKISADNKTIKKNRIDMINDLSKESNLDKLKPLFDFHIDKFFTADTRKNNPGLLKKMGGIFKTVTIKGVVEAQRAMAKRPDSTELVKTIDFPVLCLVGEKDGLTTIDSTREMAKNFPNAKMEIIPNAAHLSNLENPDAFNKFLMDYIEKIIGD